MKQTFGIMRLPDTGGPTEEYALEGLPFKPRILMVRAIGGDLIAKYYTIFGMAQQVDESTLIQSAQITGCAEGAQTATFEPDRIIKIDSLAMSLVAFTDDGATFEISTSAATDVYFYATD